MSEHVSKIAFLWAIIKTRGKDKLFENALRELEKCNKFVISSRRSFMVVKCTEEATALTD